MSGNAATNRGLANAHQRLTNNAERIRDHRLGQADHLREIGERNGNQNLLDNADRMSLQAQEQYDQRITQIGQHPGQPPAPSPTTTPPDATAGYHGAAQIPAATDPIATTAPATATPSPKPGWGQRMRAWFRFRS